MCGTARYRSWTEVPGGLRPANDLRFAGLEPRGDPVAWLVLDGREIALYREVDAAPRVVEDTPARGSLDPSRSSEQPSAGAANRVFAGRSRQAVPSAANSLHRYLTRADADPSTTAGSARRWIRDLLMDDFVVLDTETTGLGYADEVVEVGVVGPDGSDRFSSLVRPRCSRVPSGASAIHGITMDDLLDAPTFTEVYDTLLDLARGRRVVAWNAPFDERMVRQSAVGWGRHERLRGFECAMRAYAFARGLRHGRAKLERAALETGLLGARRQAHRSADDARLTLQVLMRVAGGR